MSTTFRIEGIFEPDGGVAFRAPIPTDALARMEDDEVRAATRVTEDGVPLPVGSALHEYIRQTPGCFSLWGDVLYLSASDGSDCGANGREYALVIPDSAELTARHGIFTLPRPFPPDGGLAVKVQVPPAAAAAIAADPLVAAATLLLEDGVALPTPGAQHQSIRDRGHGEYCIEGQEVRFSSSDGTDASGNGRDYVLHVPDPAAAHAIARAHEARIASDDLALLGVLTSSIFTNNTLVNNFVEQCTHALEYLKAGGAIGGTAVVLGCGARPWSALRLLAEGFDEVVANDLCAVEDAFDAHLMGEVVTMLDRVAPALGARLARRVRPDDGGSVTIDGLVTRGGLPFEQLDITSGSVDLVFSNSVMEHVMDPEGVYATTARILRPGGHAIHRIDLRDHLHFYDPLRFLRMTPEEYAPIGTENRLRLGDHLRLAREVGLETDLMSVVALVPGDRRIDGTGYPDTVAAASLDDVQPALTGTERASLAAEFRDRDPRELSVIGMTVALRKPT